MVDNTEIVDWHERLKTIFDTKIKGQWVERLSNSDHDRGDTLEFLIGKKKDNQSAPDFGDIEVKVSEAKAGSMISLFTKSPANMKLLRENYGTDALDSAGNVYKRLNATFGSNDFTNSQMNSYDFKVAVDDVEQKLKVVVRDKNTGDVVSDGEIFWNFNDLENLVVKKLSRVAVVDYDLDKENPNLIRYNSLYLNEGFTFDKFLDSVRSGEVQVDFRLGMYHTGPSAGKLHDHGTAFRISPAKFLKHGSTVDAVTMRDAFTPHPQPVRVNLLSDGSGVSGSGYCLGCGRPLRSQKSISRGYGPQCYINR